MSNRQRYLSIVIMLVLIFLALPIAYASPNDFSQTNKSTGPPLHIGESAIKINSVKTYVVREIDENGIDWTDKITRYEITIRNKPASTTTSLPPINAYVESVIGTNAFYDYIRYYGTCYSDFPVTANMTEALLWWSGSNWLVEEERPTYTATGTAIATPIYYFRWPTLGIWKSRNRFSVTAPGYTPESGTVYSPDLYIAPGA